MHRHTYYEVLGVDVGVSRQDLRAAYHARLLLTHPDKNGATGVESGEHSINLIKEAYNTLSDAERRSKYDQDLRENFKKQGFNITGAGLDLYLLAEFDEVENDGMMVWRRDCPRCTAKQAIELSESDLEKGTLDGVGGYQIMAGCLSCSLWITVAYEEE